MTSFIPPFDFTDSPSSFHTTATSSPRTHNDPAARGDLTEELKRLSAATWLTTSTYDNDNVSIHSTSTMKPVPITLPANATTSQAAQPARRSPDNDASSSYAPDDSPEPILRTATPVRISRHRATTLVVCPPTPSSFTSESAASTTTREGSPCPDYRTQRHKELPALPITPVKRVRRRLTKRSVTSLPLEPPKQENSPAGETTWRCDIHPHPLTAFRTSESVLQSTILAAGGRVITDYAYVGGFLYALPAAVPNPIVSGFSIASGAGIVVAPWSIFPEPKFDGLRMAPVGGAEELLVLRPGKAKAKKRVKNKKAEEGEGERAKHARLSSCSSWLGKLARDYGGEVTYLA